MGSSTLLRLHRSARSTLALLVLAGWLWPVAAAQATSLPVTFDGPTSGGQHFGLSGAGASAAQGAGVGVLTQGLHSSSGKLQVTSQDLQNRDLEPSDLVAPFEATSTWTVKNISGLNYSDVVYLVFTTVDARDVNLSTGTVVADYDETQVGLRIDAAANWVLFQTSGGSLGTLYYPAVRLGPLGVNAQTQVDVHYYLNQLLHYQDGNDTIVALPSLRIAMAIVPEPGTGLLLAAGLMLLAARARQRS